VSEPQVPALSGQPRLPEGSGSAVAVADSAGGGGAGDAIVVGMGGDRALYDFLCRHYSVEISAIVILSSRDLENSEYDRISAGRFVEKAEDDAAKKVAAVAGNKKATGKKAAAAAQEKVLLLIPTAVGRNLIREMDYIEHTGNESQDEQLTYLATAVIITNNNKE
jgi:hypothetical protein